MNMATEQTSLANPSRRARTIVRTVTVGGKFTREEYQALSQRASVNGQLLSEWARDVLLREIKSARWEFDLTCEVVGLQLLLMNVLAPLARGEKISAEQFQSIAKSVQSTKAKAAEEMLSRRRQSKEV
jgi:hypothetical protein